MLRDARRAWRRWRARRAIAPRLEALRDELSKVLGGRVEFSEAGARGRDSIVRVSVDGHERGVMRVLNPHLKRKPVPAAMPYRALDGGARIDSEWRIYSDCAAHGLTPRPLWRSADALLCERLPGPRLAEQLASRGDRFWSLNCIAAEALGALHQRGHTHMDASLANCIETATGCALIDFEYGPAPGLAAPGQRLYDHLRLLESGLKGTPARVLDDHAAWGKLLDRLLDEEARRVAVEPLLPALPRLAACTQLQPLLRALLPGWPARTGP